MAKSAVRKLALGRARLELPAGWSQEIDVVARAPAVDGHHPNLRLSLRTAEAPVPHEALVELYASQLAEAIDGTIELERSLPRSGRGADAMSELSFKVTLAGGRIVRHRALVAVYGDTVVTASASLRDGDDASGDLADALWAALGSLKIDPA